MTENSAVVYRIPLPKPSEPEQRPDPHVDLRAPADRDFDAGEHDQTLIPLMEVLRRSVDAARRARQEARPAWGPVVFTRDEAGCFVAQDLTGAVYGSGSTHEEALADFEGALRDRLSFLREHEASLAPKLARELRILRRLFPHAG